MTLTTLTSIGFIAVLAVATATDLKSRRIPNWLTLPALGAALAVAAIQGDFSGALVGAALGAAVFILPIFMYGSAGAGGGDVKLAAVIGAVLGLNATLTALLVAGLVASAVLIVGLATRRVTRKTPIPFGPFLAVGGIAGLFLG